MLRALDVSTWQEVGSYGTDYDALIVKAAGSDAGFYVDPKCDAHYQLAKQNGKLLGVYFFAKPSAGSAEDQAKFFVDNIQGYIGEAILVLDWEMEVENVGWAKAWLDKVYELTGVKPLIYMSGSVANSYDWSSVANADYGLWIAYWPYQYQYSWDWPSSPDEMTYGIGAWPFWAIWQFSSRNGQLDCDVANMDREGWMAYAGKRGEAPAPAPEPVPTPQPEQDYQTYVVQPGDNLSMIASRFGTTYQKIAADNGIADPNLIFPNQVLKIYGAGSAPVSQAEYYTIQPGDTLSGISATYGTSIDQLVAWNGIANADLIFAGQTIRVR